MADKKQRGKTPEAPLKTAASTNRETHIRLEEHISSQLKAMYEDVVAQPIPDRLLELLSRLDDKADKK